MSYQVVLKPLEFIARYPLSGQMLRYGESAVPNNYCSVVLLCWGWSAVQPSYNPRLSLMPVLFAHVDLH